MPKNISGSSQANLDLVAEVPEANDISNATRFEETIQGLLNNDATLQGRLTASSSFFGMETPVLRLRFLTDFLLSP